MLIAPSPSYWPPQPTKSRSCDLAVTLDLDLDSNSQELCSGILEPAIVHCPFEHSVPIKYVMNKRQLRDSFPQQERAKIAHSIPGTSKACVLGFALLKLVLPLFPRVFRWETIVGLARPGSPARKPSHISRWCG